jgi:hypothetical protein
MDWGFVMTSAKYALEVGELSGCAPDTTYTRIPNPESRTPNPESRIQNPESRIPNPESRIPNLESLNPNP